MADGRVYMFLVTAKRLRSPIGRQTLSSNKSDAEFPDWPVWEARFALRNLMQINVYDGARIGI